MNLSPLPIQKFFDNNGRPLTGGLLFTYEAGTSTKIATYTDASGGQANTNPIVLNFRGEANVWLDINSTYKFVLSPRDDTDPPTKPIWSVDDIRSGVTIEDLTQQIIGQIIWPRSAQEIATGITPTNYGYQWGDPRRYHAITVTNDEIAGLYCHGFVPTYVDSDTFTLAGDRTSFFPDRTRIAVFNNSGVRTYCQVLSTSYSAPDTTVEVRTEIGNLPTSPVAVLNYVGVQLAHMNTVMVDYNAPGVFQIVNQNDGASAAVQLTVGDFVASGLGIIATKSTTVGTYPGGVYYSLAPNNPITALTTGLAIPICFVTHDRCRLILDGDGLPSQFTTDLVVQHTNENPNGSTTSRLTVDGTATAYLRLSVASVEYGAWLADATRVLLGSFANVPVQFYTNGDLAASIDQNKNFVAGPASGAISTSATDGFLYIPSCAGTPTGTPTSKSGMAPMVVDATNNRLYFYSDGAWRNAGP
jgi:hypothetical protein